MILILASIFSLFALVYALIAGAVLYHLWHYTLPGWTAARFVVPTFLVISTFFFILAAYFLFSTSAG
ncbi:MAG: hypothetical protein HYW90_02255 [Candidatus Sungbacteria bacterium]|nr:hypothetical protein [Candidatus Sungbacteria bacterium]